VSDKSSGSFKFVDNIQIHEHNNALAPFKSKLNDQVVASGEDERLPNNDETALVAMVGSMEIGLFGKSGPVKAPLPSQESLYKAHLNRKVLDQSDLAKAQEVVASSRPQTQSLSPIKTSLTTNKYQKMPTEAELQCNAEQLAVRTARNCVERRQVMTSGAPVLSTKLPAVMSELPEKQQFSKQSPMHDINQVCLASTSRYKGLCGTAQCFVKNPISQSMIPVRALLDSGANITLINREIVRKLGLKGESTPLTINVAGGGTVIKQETEVVFQLVSKDKMFHSPSIVGFTTDSVGNPLRPVSFNPKKYQYLKDVPLADVFPSRGERPFELLISEPYFSMLEKNEQIDNKDTSLPVAKLTELGWVLRGAVGITTQIPSASAHSALARDYESFDHETMYTFDFGKFWSGENIGISKHESMHSDLSVLELKAEEFHRQTAKFDPVRRKWSVHLPWIYDDLESHRLADNLPRAIAMYHSFMQKVKPEHMDLVIEAYQDLIDQGFAEEVPPDEVNPEHPHYVMTSRGVIRADKKSTKCRIVINASLPDKGDKNKSLNKMLMQGPNKLPQIMELVMRLMFKKHIFLIDIKKMFLSIDLALTSDKDMLRYVWAKPGETPKLYRLRTLGFGIISSPFQAMTCLQDTAKELATKYPEASEAILSNTYMDDNSDGDNDLSTTKHLLKDILTVMESGGFYGHKISASSSEILEGIDPERIDNSRTVSVLGLRLDHDTGEFMFDMDEKFEKFNANAERITRRDTVALASMIFDTQGFVSPYVMQFKKLLPMLWHNQTAWDENLIGKMTKDENGKEIPDPVAAKAVLRFKEWIADIPRLKELRFARFIEGKVDFIAIFGDASKTGIGVVAYAVKQLENGERRSQILYSKSSLMPKTMRGKAITGDALTIARAELIAITLCVNMSEYIQNALKPYISSKQVHIFTDSLLNLQRLKRGKGKSKPWEERRVCQILENKGDSLVSFCPGVLNPADLPSRGCNMDELTSRLKFWKEGPTFLLQSKDEWPKEPCTEAKSKDETAMSDSDYGVELDLYFTQLKSMAIADAEEKRGHALAAQVSTQHKTTS
jgi:hypothetical protein